jgi:carboxyl-terminal processing protease
VKDAFEASLGKKTMEYGLNFDEDEEGNVMIDDLKPGSSAFQSGQLNEGDKIQSVQIGSQTPQNVSELDVTQVYQIITNASDNKVTLTVKKPDGSTRQVILRKEIQEADEDENKVKSFILKGKKSIGYISLPAFYSDWEDSQGINGCANDVAKEIVKLKKDAIDGLILDVRYNGGGSMQEAIELAGIFIDAGPVGQYRSRDGKVITLKDANRGTIYDGPLLLMVNGYSASASEMIAATLQDYNRALVVGSPTFGKATAQVILPLDTTIDLNTYDGTKAADSYIKLTISTLYRLNGTSAQINGVKPHIILPDISRASQQGEANERFALRTIDIAANKYYKPLVSLQLNSLESFAKSEIEAPGFFSEVNRYLNKAKINQQPKDQSLLLADAIQNKKNLPVLEIPPSKEKKDKTFTITNHKFEIQRMQSNKALLEMNEERKNSLLTDPYIQIAFDLLLLMAN